MEEDTMSSRKPVGSALAQKRKAAEDDAAIGYDKFNWEELADQGKVVLFCFSSFLHGLCFYAFEAHRHCIPLDPLQWIIAEGADCAGIEDIFGEKQAVS
jgi:hypothetical protein